MRPQLLHRLLGSEWPPCVSLPVMYRLAVYNNVELLFLNPFMLTHYSVTTKDSD